MELINIIRIKNIDNIFCKYSTKIYYEYYNIIHQNEIEDINVELKDYFKNNIVDINDDINKIDDCNLIISPSHSDTYYILKQLNSEKREKVLVICFDMHSDTYDYNDSLWKGNVFSKLLKENIIDHFLVYGVPNYKIKNTLNDVPKDIKEKVKIKKTFNLKKYLRTIKPTTIFISIDIDCLDTRKNKYSALEYCPMTILSNLSKIKKDFYSDEEIIELVKGCILVKNELGYSNLYKVGENRTSIEKIIKYIKKIKKYCTRYKINLGFYNKKIYADISEVNGYDYSKKTFEVIVKLIDELI